MAWQPWQRTVRSDRGWFLIVVLVFTISTGGLAGAYAVYRATGPHPEVTVFVRRVKGYANRILKVGRLRQPRR